MSHAQPFIGGLRLDPHRLCLSLIQGPEFGWQAPLGMDHSTYIRPQTDDQGSKPICAAVSLQNMYEFLCTVAGYKYGDFDAQAVYDHGQDISGRIGDGLTLEVAFQSAMELGYFAKNTRVREIPADPVLFRWAIVRYGIIYSAYQVTKGWLNSHGTIGDDDTVLGGHGVCSCAYDDIDGYNDLPAGPDVWNQWNRWGRTLRGHKDAYGLARLTWAQWRKQYMYGLVIYQEAA